MAAQLGIKGVIGWAEESTWGTPVAAARYMPNAPGSRLQRKVEVVAVDLLSNGGPLSPVLIDTNILSDRVTGTLSGPITMNDYWLTTALKHAMGGLVTAGSGPYTHTFTMATDLPAGLTILQQNNDVKESFEGCKISRLVLTYTARQVAQWSADIIGQTSGAEGSPASPTFTTGRLYLPGQTAGTIGWNSLTSTARRVVVTIDNKLTERDELGSLYTAEPTRSAMAEVTIEVEQYRTVNSFKTGYLAGTQSNFTFTATTGTSSIAHTLHNAQIITYDDGHAADVGAVIERFTLRGQADSTNKGLGIVVTNANSASI